MKTLLLVIPIALLAQGLVFGQSEEKKLWQPSLWKADDPRLANPINRFHLKNPLNSINKVHFENDFNPINKYRLDNPLNPINKFRIDNMLNPINRYNLDSPLNPINQYRSPPDAPERGMFKLGLDEDLNESGDGGLSFDLDSNWLDMASEWVE